MIDKVIVSGQQAIVTSNECYIAYCPLPVT